MKSIARRLCFSCSSSSPLTCRTIRQKSSSVSGWTKTLTSFLAGVDGDVVASSDTEASQQSTKKKQRVVDAEPLPKATDKLARLPTWLEDWRTEFPPETPSDRRYRNLEATRRIAKIAVDRVLEPSAVALLGVSASVVLGLGAIEGTVMCAELPFFNFDSACFVGRYAFEQLLPSCVWLTQDAKLIATAMGYDPKALLVTLDPTNASDAATLLNIQLLATSRSMAAGFMLLAQLVRAGAIGAAAPGVYEKRVRLGKEPPVLPKEGGLIFRLVGMESDATAVSLFRMGHHIFPVYEDPSLMAPIVAQHSNGKRLPVYWCVRPDRYGTIHSWKGLPVSSDCFIRTRMGRNVLLLEADATNSDDPLSLGEHALDLTIDDASQGFNRIKELFESSSTVGEFRTLRVFLGNSVLLAKSGGGHSFTLRHRVKYAKEVDVLIDSRAPVLNEILSWCDRVAGKHKRILVQTSNRQYFLSLQLLMERYGYDIYDPLDWSASILTLEDGLRDELEAAVNEEAEMATLTEDKSTTEGREFRSLLHVLVDENETGPVVSGNDDDQGTKRARQGTLRRLAKLSQLPRLIYYDKTAETVNAVQALVSAGAVEAANCCALLDKQDGTVTLESMLNSQSGLVQDDKRNWIRKASSSHGEPGEAVVGQEDASNSNGLHIICSSTIYDDLFRQVRQWTRMGYNATQIQRELDIRYQHIIKQSQEVRETVAEVTLEEEDSETAPEMKTPSPENTPLPDESSEEEGYKNT